MFRKSFISIYFLPEKLLVFQLSSNKKKVIKFASVELPAGLIKEYKVADVKGLAKVIKNVWSKFHLKEKTVGIVLPEFSTFTKFIKLPNLNISELGEAVAWQAQEFLPSQATDMIMDWRVVEKTAQGFEVMIVAVNKEILANYVTAVESAELFPLVVETPSVCLTRITQKEDRGVLTLYKNFGETLLIVSQKLKVIGTSVIHTQSDDEIVKTASRMISHYSSTSQKEISVEKVLVGGGEANEDLLQKLTPTLKLPIEKIVPLVKGLNDREQQEYLIPLSMQLTDPAEPSDPSSLNLLPAPLVEKYKRERTKLQVWSLTLTITLFVWIAFLVSIGGYLFISQQISDLKKSNSLQKQISQQRETKAKEIQEINEVSKRIIQIKNLSVLPQTILNEIEKAKPQGIRIDNYDLDLDKGEISVGGVSSDRVTLLTFKQSLETSTNVSEVTIPISSFEKEADLEFRISFKWSSLTTSQSGGKK